MTKGGTSIQSTTVQKVSFLLLPYYSISFLICYVYLLYVVRFIKTIFSSDQVPVAPAVEGDIDQIAVLTSNVLFFVVLFIFAVFET